MINFIFSIEPFSEQAIENIEQSTNCRFVHIERDSFFDYSSLYEIEALICRDRDPIDKILDVCINLKFVFIVSVGVERLPFKQLEERGTIVCNPKGLNAQIMSEYVMGAILAHSTRVWENLTNQRSNHWKKFQCIDSLTDKTLLIVGAGSTGKLVAEKAKAFGMKTIGIKRNVCDIPAFDKIHPLSEIDCVLGEADYVVCTIPLTQSTERLFNENRFHRMKPSSVFINISRGKIIVESDLVKCLNDNVLCAAVLDVFEKEPLEQESELWNTPNLYITPHSSGRLPGFVDRTAKYLISSFNAFNNNETCIPNKVNLIHGY